MKHMKLKMSSMAALFAFFLLGVGLLGTRIAASASDTTTPSPTPSPGVTATPTPSPTPSPAPAPVTTKTSGGLAVVWNSAADGIGTVQVKYTTEEVEVTSTKKLYYAILKKDSDVGAKPADLIAAANGGLGNTYLIDFSTISSSKACYIGLATTTIAGSDGLVPVTNVTIAPTQRKIVFNVDWSVEGSEAKNNRIFTSVEVTGNDSVTTKYIQGTATQTNEKSISELSIQWRKGMNTAWESTSNLTNVKWDSMKTGGAVVYFRLDAKDSGVANPNAANVPVDAGYRYSKENKIKMSITRATAFKLDVSKLTLNFKNGTQFRVSGAADWITVLPYLASSTKTDSAIRDTTNKTAFDPNKENTQVKVSYLSVAEVKKALGSTAPAADQPIILETRIAATPKKTASRIGTVTIPVQAEAPKAEIVHDGKQWTVNGISIADTSVAANFEYTLADADDVKNEKINLTMVKWSSIKNGTSLKDTAKSTYTTLDKSRKTVNITDANAVLLIRRKGVTASSKTKAALASKYVSLKIPPKQAAASGTPTPTPTGTPSGTPTGTPTPTPTPTIAP
ncbi:MAG: hypothetical protein K6E85_09225 [Lachnospiraceae bacterium]|nr:hypothetical protein [Lachnospiraceae bacterium]